MRSTFYRLYKLIRVGNMAFFLGELDRAYDSLNDALALFTKLNNRKAIGIANNNLGNLMLTIYRTMMKTGAPMMYDISRQKVVQRGCAYFKKAVDLGEEALKKINDKEGFSINYLIFMQQVSNRYFNRALFLLSIHKDRYSPSNAYEQGIMDLTTCRDMDREVVDNGDHVGFKGDKEVYFELLMGRIKGILMLLKLGYDDSWGIDDLFEEARAELLSALETYSHEGHPLFDELDPAGQMQRLDSTLIDYHLYMAEQAPSENQDEKWEHIRKSAEIAVRMMIEDDYVIGEAAMLALKALIEYTHVASQDDLKEDPSDVRSTLFQYRHHIGEILSMSNSSHDILGRERLNACNAGDFSLEVF